MSNRVTLAQLREMTGEQASALPVDQIAALLEDVAELKADTKRLDDLLHTALTNRYADQAAAARRAAGKDTGTVTLRDGDFAIKADLPAKVEWDQELLASAVETVKGWGEKPEDYVKAALSVPESRYKAWPESIRKVFEPARTVGVGRPTFKVEPAKREAA